MTPHDVPPVTGTSRRTFLAGGTALGATLLGAAAMPGFAHAREAAPAPFSLGVASGEPLPDGVVLWTRLARDPVAPDGLGGMPHRVMPVQWQVATDERFRNVVARGTTLARPEEAHSVHVEVSGLRPGAEYFYRFRSRGDLSPTGRTKTAPAPGARLDTFAFAFASCQNYPAGFYTAHRHLSEEDLDLVAFLGDYIYEGTGASEIGRSHVPEAEIWSLADYRVRTAQYRADGDLQAAHAAFPWAVVFDDHEVENNWADENSQNDTEPDQDPAVFLRRRARAFQAFYEHMPLRRAQRPSGPDLQLYRTLTFGDLAQLHLLDTRQYRDVQVGDGQHGDPSRTILGARQKEWLKQGTSSSSARWNVLAQQVFFSRRDFNAGDSTNFSNDAWDAYRVERDEIRDHLADVSNPVVITGDVHASYVCDVLADFDDPSSATVATELVGTSITSGGDGVEQNPGDAVQLAENAHIKFINRRRGYVRNVLTRDSWTADYRTVDYVTTPAAPISTKASFTIADGEPGAHRS